MPIVLAVDLGGTKTALARVDERGVVHDRVSLPAAHTLDATMAQVAGAARDVAAVGIIVPGICVPETGEAWCPNPWASTGCRSGAPSRRALRTCWPRTGRPSWRRASS